MTREIMMLLMVISAALLTIGLSRIVILLSHRSVNLNRTV